MAQFEPGAGEPGSSAIHKDSSIFVEWATECTVQRGYVKISDTAFMYEGNNYATHGEASDAAGKADGIVVSLGDSGIAVLQCAHPITNLEGFDFAVFENGFRAQESPYQYFLELAFVEVSSDGERFVRFPAYSNTPVAPQVSTFGQIDPTLIHNLAGKYEVSYGTPFDLEELKDSTGIDIGNITHVKIVDVVGSVQAEYAGLDVQGRRVNDPWPSPFATGGFDLDALGVIHTHNILREESGKRIGYPVKIYPNPVRAGEYVNFLLPEKYLEVKKARVFLYDGTGRLISDGQIVLEENTTFDIPGSINSGVYLLSVRAGEVCFNKVIYIIK